jgi:hypothetical protein
MTLEEMDLEDVALKEFIDPLKRAAQHDVDLAATVRSAREC